MPNKRSPWVGIIILLVVIGLIATYSSFFTESGKSNNTSSPVASENTNSVPLVKYQGKDQIDALSLLKESNQVETQSSSLGEMVTAINGQKTQGNQYWAFYLNGQLSNKGADQTVTTNSDTIEWKLENY